MGLLRVKDSKGNWTPASVLDVDAIAMSGYQYSTDEICVGCWIDGKPLYRKVISTTSNSSNTAKSYVIDGIDADNIVSIYGIIYKANGSRIVCPSIYPGTTTGIWFDCGGKGSGNTYLSIYNNDDSLYSRPITVTIEYTKTTDAENSFTLDMIDTATLDTEATDNEVNDVLGGDE